MVAIFLILTGLAVCLAVDYRKGLCVAASFLVVLPNELMLRTAGNLPNFPATRLIVIMVFIFWVFAGAKRKNYKRIPFLTALLFFAISNLFSLLFGIDFSSGLKQYLSFTFEILLFYIIIQSSITDREFGVKVLISVWLGLLLVAVLGIIEKKTGWNAMTWAIPSFEIEEPGQVRSTFSHRILFGAAMAMGFPTAVSLYLLKVRGRWKYILSVGVFLTACYFSHSRGPWLGAAVALLVFFLFGSMRTRKMILVVLFLVFMILVVRPGVRQTIFGLSADTLDKDSFKGGTYQYRWELWGIAYNEVSKSPVRILFGYGPGSTASLGIAQGERGKRDVYWSWDNHYAWTLLETGFLGLISSILLYATVFVRLVRSRRKVEKVDRGALAGIIASLVVLMFMMTNVMIFARQLFFLFWILVAVGNVLVKRRQESPEILAKEETGGTAIIQNLGLLQQRPKPSFTLKGRDN